MPHSQYLAGSVIHQDMRNAAHPIGVQRSPHQPYAVFLIIQHLIRLLAFHALAVLFDPNTLCFFEEILCVGYRAKIILCLKIVDIILIFTHGKGLNIRRQTFDDRCNYSTDAHNRKDQYRRKRRLSFYHLCHPPNALNATRPKEQDRRY